MGNQKTNLNCWEGISEFNYTDLFDIEYANSLDSYIKDLLNLGEEQKAVENLSKLYFYFPKYQKSINLFNRYKLEVLKYWKEYWKDEAYIKRVFSI